MKLQGKIDSKSGIKSIFGYLLDEDNVSTIREAKILIDDEVYYTPAVLFKQFVQDKYTNGYHGFKIEIPKKFRDSQKTTHIVELRDKHSNTFVDKKEIIFFNNSVQLNSKHAITSLHRKKSTPKVSIIVPVYNTGFILEKTLSSIVNQTFRDIEIIVVNDRSTDNSENIIAKYIKQDNRIKYISHVSNMSSSQARKNGIAIADGDYVMFVDGDDELTPNCVEIAYSTIKDKNVDIVNFGTKVENCGNMAQSRIDMNQRLLEPFNGRIEGDIQKACFIDKKFAFNVWNKIYKTKIVKDAFSCVENGCFPKAQDLYAFFYIAKFAKSYFGMSDQLYKYNFGLGVTGGDSIDLDRFKKLISESLILKALQRDKNYASTEQDRVIIENIEFNLLTECYSKFENQLEDKYKNKAFDLLVNAFGSSSFVSYLSRKYWYQRPKIAEQIKDYSFFQRKKRDKKISVIALYYNTLSNGGAQRVTVQIANMLSKAYKVIIISDEKTKNDSNEYPIDESIIHEYLPDSEIARVEKYKIRASKWEYLINKYKIELVITGLWISPATFWDIVTLKLHNVSVVIHAHSICAFPYKLEDQTSLDLIYRYMMCDGVVSLSKCDQFYITSFNKNCLNIANPPTESFILKSDVVREKKGFNILWVGRISNEKRPLDAIRMMEKLVKVMPQCHLSIVGAGNPTLESSMKKLINEKSLESNITLEGFTIDVDKYYSSADIFICTSEYEGWSLTIGEAMSHHLPIVSYDLPYLSFFEDGRGIVPIKQGNFSHMATEIENLLTNRNYLNELGENAYKNLSDKYNQDILIKWKQLISNIESCETKGIDNYTADDIDKIKSIVFFKITEFQNNIKSMLLNEKIQLRKELQRRS